MKHVAGGNLNMSDSSSRQVETLFKVYMYFCLLACIIPHSSQMSLCHRELFTKAVIKEYVISGIINGLYIVYLCFLDQLNKRTFEKIFRFVNPTHCLTKGCKVTAP